MAGEYQGQKTFLGLTPADAVSIAGASFGRGGIGRHKGGPLLQPGYFLTPLGSALKAGEERGREQFKEEEFLGSIRGSEGLSPRQEAFGKYSPELLAKLLATSELQAQKVEQMKAGAGFDLAAQAQRETAAMAREEARAAAAMAREQAGNESALRRAEIMASRGFAPAAPQMLQDKEGSMFLFDPTTRQVLRQDEAGGWAPTPAPKGLMKAGGQQGLSVTTNPDGTTSISYGGAARPLTEAQGKATALGMRGGEAADQLNAIESTGYVPTLATGAKQYVGEALGSKNLYLDAEAQMYEQALLNFGTAIGRFESGAAIPEPEWNRFVNQYGARPGSTPEEIAQKRQNRETAIRGIGVAAGPGRTALPPSPGLPKIPVGGANEVDFNDLP